MTQIPIERVSGVKFVPVSDSRRRMDFLAKIAKALGIEDATEDKVLEALEGRVNLSEIAKALEVEAEDLNAEKLVEAVKAKIDEKPAEKSLEEQAKDEGKIVVEAADFATIKRDAEAGRKASEELHQSKFDSAYAKALEELRVDAKDETKARFQKLYDADAETTLEALDNLAALAPTEPRGKTGKPGTTAPDNVDADRQEFHERVQAYAAEHKVEYVEALDKVIELDAKENG